LLAQVTQLLLELVELFLLAQVEVVGIVCFQQSLLLVAAGAVPILVVGQELPVDQEVQVVGVEMETT
jgi:hypothetical protein